MPPLRYLLLGGLLAAVPARGVITFGDESDFTKPTTDGSPWANVAQIGGHSGSGVYLGNGFVLTAKHVNLFSPGSPAMPVLLNGMRYDLDPSFGVFGELELNGVDLKVLKIAGDPHLPSIPLASSTDVDTGVASTLIGWGVGKGDPIPNQGWTWGGDGTGLQRHGTNFTAAAAGVTPGGGDAALVTSFDPGLGESVGQLTLYDSGSGLFQFLDGVWKLVGIGDEVDDQSGGQALYDEDLMMSGNQPSQSYYLRMETYRDQINAVISVPEPSLGLTLALGGGTLTALSSRRPRKPPHAPP